MLPTYTVPVINDGNINLHFIIQNDQTEHDNRTAIVFVLPLVYGFCACELDFLVKMSSQQMVQFNNGRQYPILGLGTWQVIFILQL